MPDTERIARGVYLVGGPQISHAEDATSFVIDFGGEAVMIDCGAGRSLKTILANIDAAGIDPRSISTLILTHAHIDHIGAAPELRRRLDLKILIHELDAQAIETGDFVRTAADWYGVDFPPTPIDRKLAVSEETLSFNGENLRCLHAPGHTPGSIVILLERDGRRILFGQDIHGPFLPAFGSDITRWRTSMEMILALKPDILCEGHFGIFRSNDSVERYIRRCLHQNG
ncbi:MAG: MBL fold metallo-hydrolase [Deltaproteobacteria bacterium]|nr:MBL fold metallo-hydrolase [Deltaproteobacteria bacterium]